MIDPVSVERLLVYIGSQCVGTLERTQHGVRFAYLSDYAALHSDDGACAIAFAMPVRAAAYEVRGASLHPFFAGLLPEGMRLRALVRSLKTSEDDMFSMLAAVGGDAVGAVAACVADELDTPIEVPDLRDAETGSFREWYDASLAFGERRAMGHRVAIAGVQPKVSAGMMSFPVRSGRMRHDFIVKIAPDEYPRLVENEAFFMQLARDVGIETAEVEILQDREGATALAVRRFDRERRRDGSVVKFAQEDACQLLDRYPADKYRLPIREIAAALEVCSAPAVERLRLLRLSAFSYLIANGDLHAKNISVQRHVEPRGDVAVDEIVRLTPAYDLLSTLPYGDDRMALAIEGRDTKLRRADFVAFGERIGVRRAATESMLDRLVAAIEQKMGDLATIGLGEKKTRHLERVIVQRLDALRR